AIAVYLATYFNRSYLRFEGRAIVVRCWRERSYDSHEAARFRAERSGKGFVIWLDFRNGGSLGLAQLVAGFVSLRSAQRKADKLNHDLEISRRYEGPDLSGTST
ncbi:MAG TPA: hypothetical protein VGW79_00155, partial [Actinomycetota bacterium]|nr:hypothetical protein [Actinomycetota bacterium]